MYELDDTIVAVSSPTSDNRVIIRVTGPGTLKKVNQVFAPHIGEKAGLFSGSLAVGSGLELDAKLYFFSAPASYTGQTLAEIHIHTNSSVTEALLGRLLARGLGAPKREKGRLGNPLRLAGPGEFTARAYLNGKIDLAQAEAVNEIIVGSNRFQLAAAEKILSGSLAETTEKIRTCLLNLLSLVEAGLDFSGEDIEFITVEEAAGELAQIKAKLEQLSAGRYADESVVDLPDVGVAGAPNAGKSSLVNKLLGRARSIVSATRRTTRDVLTGVLGLTHARCVLFDCAGLTAQPTNIIDELAQEAAIKALQNSLAVVFCVDVSRPDWAEDIATRKLIEPHVLIPVATKSDLLSEKVLTSQLDRLGELFAADFLPTSARTDLGLERLKKTIDKRIIEQALPAAKRDMQYGPGDRMHAVTLTARHRHAVAEAIENIDQCVKELKAGNDELAAMLLRAAYQGISDIDRYSIDERILDNIFARFCIGK